MGFHLSAFFFSDLPLLHAAQCSLYLDHSTVVWVPASALLIRLLNQSPRGTMLAMIAKPSVAATGERIES